jgi:hypothetical protein
MFAEKAIMDSASCVISDEISFAFFMEVTHLSEVLSRVFSSSFIKELSGGVRSREVPDTGVILSTPKFRVIEFKALLNASDDCVILDVSIIFDFFKHSVSEIGSRSVIRHLLQLA